MKNIKHEETNKHKKNRSNGVRNNSIEEQKEEFKKLKRERETASSTTRRKIRINVKQNAKEKAK